VLPCGAANRSLVAVNGEGQQLECFGGCSVDVATGADVPARGAVVGVGEFVVFGSVRCADEAALLVSRDGGVLPTDGDGEQVRAT